MISVNDMSDIAEFKDFFVILPNSNMAQWNSSNYIKKYKGKKSSKNFSYNSFNNKNYLSVKQLRDLLKKY